MGRGRPAAWRPDEHRRPGRVTTGPANEWPLVGRGGELALIKQVRTSGPTASVIITGVVGAGKTRLANTALADAASEGWATVSLQASSSLTPLPLGPLRAVLRIPSSHDLDRLVGLVEDSLLSMRSSRGLVVLVDDCHDLDDESAAMIHRLVANGSLTAIVTARSGKSVPDELAALRTEGLAERVDLQNLSLPDTAEVMARWFGGPVHNGSVEGVWKATGGNPLCLREVVLAAEESGTLTNAEGEWHWAGDWDEGTPLEDVVADRLDRLDSDQLTVLEVLTVAGPLPLDVLTGVTDLRTVLGLDARGLVQIERHGQRIDATITHTLHAEMLRERMEPLLQQSLRWNLIEALLRTGARRAEDRVRIASWSLESGLDVDPVTLTLRSDATVFGMTGAIGARLGEILPPDAVTGSGTNGRGGAAGS